MRDRAVGDATADATAKDASATRTLSTIDSWATQIGSAWATYQKQIAEATQAEIAAMTGTALSYFTSLADNQLDLVKDSTDEGDKLNGKLADEAKVLRGLGHWQRTIGLAPWHELAGDVWHAAGNADRFTEKIRVKIEVTAKLMKYLCAAAR